jgi:excisionase family DNA binding protein
MTMAAIELPIKLEQYWTTKQVAERLHCTESCVKRWLWSGKLERVKAGDRTLITETEIQAFIVRSTPKPQPTPRAALHVM